MRTFSAAVALLGCAALAGACGSGGGTPDRAAPPVSVSAGAPVRSAGCRLRHTPRSGWSDHTIASGGVERQYRLTVPDDYDGTEPYALVLGLHALTVNFKIIPSTSGFDQAGAYHFIGVAPSGRFDGATPYWDAAPTSDNYDVDFIARLLDHLEATMCIDATRVFSAGMSNGAQMSSLLACRLPDRIAAIAPVSGEEFPAPCTGKPVPILAFHGTADPAIPYTGGGLSSTYIADTYVYKGHPPPDLPEPLGVDASMARWAAHNGCDPQYDEVRVAPHILRRTWRHCAASTVLYVVEGGGHVWPGRPLPHFDARYGRGTTEIHATDLMFRFFFGDRPR